MLRATSRAARKTKSEEFGAGARTRTADLLITNQLLYQLSYAGTKVGLERTASARSRYSSMDDEHSSAEMEIVIQGV